MIKNVFLLICFCAITATMNAQNKVAELHYKTVII